MGLKSVGYWTIIWYPCIAFSFAFQCQIPVIGVVTFAIGKHKCLFTGLPFIAYSCNVLSNEHRTLCEHHNIAQQLVTCGSMWFDIQSIAMEFRWWGRQILTILHFRKAYTVLQKVWTNSTLAQQLVFVHVKLRSLSQDQNRPVPSGAHSLLLQVSAVHCIFVFLLL